MKLTVGKSSTPSEEANGHRLFPRFREQVDNEMERGGNRSRRGYRQQIGKRDC